MNLRIAILFFFARFSIVPSDAVKEDVKNVLIDKINVEDRIDEFIRNDESINNVTNTDNEEYIFRKKRKIVSERVLYNAALFPLLGQIYNWRKLQIEGFEKTLIFSLIFSGLLGFYIYNFFMYASPSNSSSSINLKYYRRKTYTLSFLIITCLVSFFDSYLTVYRKTSDFSNNLNCSKIIDFN